MKKKYLILAAVLVLISGALFYMVKTGHRPKGPSQSAPSTQVRQTVASASPDPNSRTPQPEQPDRETPAIEIPAEKQQLIGAKTVEVSVRPLKKVIRTVGLIEYDERRLATVNTKFEGWVEKLYVDYNGKYVKKGEPLADLYSPELVSTQQEFINLLKWSKNSGDVKNEQVGKMLMRDADIMIEAVKQRLRLWDISDAQIKKIADSGEPLRTLTLYSPVNGYVVQKNVLQGMKVMPGEKLFDIADLSTLWVIADIYEGELAMVKPGETAKITLSYFPGKEFSSRLEYVYPSISGATRSAKVRFVVPNYGGKLKPQMYTNIEVKIELGKRLSIPDGAVIDTGERQIVYVDKGDETFEPREVALGVRAEGMREVLAGLKAGEKVASSATFLIDSEAQLKNVTPLSGHKH